MRAPSQEKDSEACMRGRPDHEGVDLSTATGEIDPLEKAARPYRGLRGRAGGYRAAPTGSESCARRAPRAAARVSTSTFASDCTCA